MKRSLFIVLLVLALVSTHFLLAQGPSGSGSVPPPPTQGGAPGGTNDVSITPFLWILALAGTYLGFKKANNQ